MAWQDICEGSTFAAAPPTTRAPRPKPIADRVGTGDADVAEHRRIDGRMRRVAKPVEGFIVLSVKLRRAEAEAFQRSCAELGLRPNRAFRLFARRTAGYLDPDAAMLDELRAIVRQLTGVATNINQIARAVNRTGHADLDAVMRERAAFGPILRRTDGLIRQVLDAPTRKREGLERLARAPEQDEREGEGHTEANGTSP